MRTYEELNYILNTETSFESTDDIETSTQTFNRIENPTVKHLNGQLGKYPPVQHAHGVADLNSDGRKLLYEGVDEYRQKNAHHPPDHYRKLFIQHVSRVVEDSSRNYKGSDSTRKNTPEKATIKANALFGSEGLRLYKQALQEEMNSKEYRDAIFNESTRFVPGQTWEKTPVIIIGGPSGSGKTYATGEVIKQVNQLPKEDDNSGNLITSVDGGICREVSQMRKLAIRAANKKGYSGIGDLHHQSEILEGAKKCVKNAALADEKFGLVIPDTYSTWLNPLNKGKEFMQGITRSDRQLIFSKVVGENPDEFQEVVKHMGTRRAWLTEGFDDIQLDLNSREGLAESKAYGPSGFKFGKNGSDAASLYYVELQKRHHQPNLSLSVVNDLILLRMVNPDPELWGPANPGQEGIFMVSKRTYEAWNQLSPDEKSLKGLREYNKENPRSTILLSKDFEQLIRAEAEKGEASEIDTESELEIESDVDTESNLETNDGSLSFKEKFEELKEEKNTAEKSEERSKSLKEDIHPQASASLLVNSMSKSIFKSEQTKEKEKTDELTTKKSSL